MKELPSEGLHEMILFLEQNLHHFRAKVFLRIFAHETERILRNFLHKFLSKLTKIEILSRELNN